MTATSNRLIGTEKVHAAPFSETGERALVGLIDDGIDILHSAFLRADGKSRITLIWDQGADTPDDADGTVPFGRLYSAEEISQFVEQSRGPLGLAAAHGTRVTSIAAGRAAATASTDANAFQGGVAPDAEIVFVKTKQSSDDGSSVSAAMANILAVNFIADVARAKEKPCAVNLSFGTNVGAHDGTAVLENEIDNLTRNGTLPGLCFIKSAGNEQSSASQATLELAPSSTGEFVWNARTIDRGSDVIDIWFKTVDVFKFRLHQPDDLGAGSTEWLSLDQRTVESELPNGNTVRLIYLPLRPENGDARVTVQVFPGSQDRIHGGDWRLEVSSSDELPAGGVINAWLERDDRRPIKFKDHQSGEGRITIPGTARSVITVGAVENTDSRKVWKSSSRGPTRDGRFKPDLCAPGAKVASAVAGSGDQAGQASGTSYAAPHATGAVALIFSQQSRIGQAFFNALQLQAILSQNCDGFDGRWRKAQGFGTLNIGRVFQRISDL